MLAGTEDYYEALARSRYLISNDDMQAWYVKREGQVYVQTWHGTPLKRIGFDISQPQFISGTVPGPPGAGGGEVGPAAVPQPVQHADHAPGVPLRRRDLRVRLPPQRRAVQRRRAGWRRQVRARLGIPAGKRVILYAPTWRDDQYYASGRYRFDFRLDLEQAWRELGDDYVILLRGHHHMADDVPPGTRPGFVLT